jgi:hypothetical protein
MTEQQAYQVLHQYPGFELRHYPAYVVAEVEVSGDFDRASNAGFGPLVSFIGGRNHSSRRIAMTAPVIQEPSGADGMKIAMTAPVIQEPSGSQRHIVQFVMPAEMPLEAMPTPADSRVALRLVPAHDAAVVRYSGFASASKYDSKLTALIAALSQVGLAQAGTPRSARFDPPWTPPFLRRNEVIVPVRKTS